MNDYLKSSEFIGDMYAFVRESNKIENILRDPTAEEVSASMDIIKLDVIRVADLENVVNVYTNGYAKLRREFNNNVRVGNHVAPIGGPEIVSRLAEILKGVNDGSLNPYEAHVRYETLHPFEDGNGRSGRILWAWQMVRNYTNPHIHGWNPGIKIQFLHAFYYQTLQFSRPPK